MSFQNSPPLATDAYVHVGIGEMNGVVPAWIHHKPILGINETYKRARSNVTIRRSCKLLTLLIPHSGMGAWLPPSRCTRMLMGLPRRQREIQKVVQRL